MAYLTGPWPVDGVTHRYITRERLQALLESLPEGALLMVNAVGNLAVMQGLTPEGNGYTAQIGHLDLGWETFEAYP